MKKLSLAIVLLCLSALPSCATSHAVRYAYGHDSFFAEPVTKPQGDPSRAFFAPPLIMLSVVWDVVTVPTQAIFGIWPWWGDKSLSMDPNKY